MSWVAAGSAAVGLAGSFMGGGSGSSTPPMPVSQTTGNKAITIENGFRLKPETAAILAAGAVAVAALIVFSRRAK